MKKRRLIIAFLSMGVALSATSLSFSYAWYAAGTQLRVDDINVQIRGDRNLTVSTQEYEGFVSDLQTEQLRKTGFFTPVSTCFASTWAGERTPRFYDMSRCMWDLHGVPALFNADKNGYLTQELYLQADDDVIVTIDPSTTKAVYKETLNRAYAQQLAADLGGSSDEYFAKLSTIQNCVRISLLVDDQYAIYDPNPGNEDMIYYGGALDNDNDRLYDYYQDPDTGEFYEVFYGETFDRSKLVYKDPYLVDTYPEGKTEFSAFTAGHAAGVHVLDLEASKPYIPVEPRLVPHDFTPESVPFSFELDAYTPKKITVSFYLEGWDLDSVNGAMGSSFDIKLAFKIFRER